MPFKIKLFTTWILIHHFAAAQLPSGFTVLNNEIPELEVELRYATSKNFMGRPVVAYHSDLAIGSSELAIQLKKVQAQLRSMGYGIKIYDAYRPQSAVNDFIKWSKIPNDTMSKHEYYPKLKKNMLREALNAFFEIREVPGLKKKPSTSELIDWLKLLMADDIPDEILTNRDPSKAIPPLYGALVKNEQDVHLLERLAFMNRRDSRG